MQCNFSSAFVVLARSVGIPARVVSGWVVGSYPVRQDGVCRTRLTSGPRWHSRVLGWVAVRADGKRRRSTSEDH